MTILTDKPITCLALLLGASGTLSAAPDFSLSIQSNATAGVTNGSHERTAVHAHDPSDDYNLQGIDVALSMRANEYIEGFLNNVISGEDELESEWEEGFLKFKNLPLPGNAGTLEVRTGFYYNRLGTENNVHLHGWNFVNANLSTGLFLGEEGLNTQGAELSWVKELTSGDFIISGSYGKAREHEEHEGEEHEGEEEEHGEENESQDLAYFNHDLVTVRAQLRHNTTDFFQHRIGVDFAQGDNGYGRDTSLFGTDYTFTWRENGLERGGKEITAGVEYFNRNVEWQDEIDASNIGDTGQQSLALKTSYAWNENWRVGARYEWVESASGDVFSFDKYQRASLALTHSKELNDDWRSITRLQYNHDKIGDNSSNNLYLQLGFSFGGREVR